ncbi:MBL fold metallo-hydrolase [Rhodocytophaga aerolata]|uniref:MBL fold metallo-hydrolase n=1 Tax=Rhodocytophaga aerolata TaxID=455078 RepID=A0ABT8RD42_9BACT|nr:MBL fold metallo-hydrolase [Rhodocytophaga aerolata]MDO1449259.1 MBL fold metallo-hydrolase [Rhodocytophaga aerolata]
MKIHQFEDKGLSHFSYAILSECESQIILIDPARDPSPYYAYAGENGAKIIGVIETHPHADFISSHLEIHQLTGATIYTSSLAGADYPHQAFDEGDVISFGKIKLKAFNTPGHSPDGISIVLEHQGKDKAVFTGDTLFIGDVGRPDLRENVGNMKAKREQLARQLYQSTRHKLMKLADEVVVYPAHGSGSLCGKSLSDAHSSTIGGEKVSNYALQPMSEEVFVKVLLEDQPFIPKYFEYNVALNKQGAPDYEPSIKAVRRLEDNFKPEEGAIIVDARGQKEFKSSHLKGSINIQNGAKFETWLGSIVSPQEAWYLVADSEKELNELIRKAAKIGYELTLKGAFLYNKTEGKKSAFFDKGTFLDAQDKFTIVDIRNESETKEGTFFKDAITIPLPELRERAKEIPANKPIVVHCAGGYRSAAGSSILESLIGAKAEILDMSEAVNELKKS